MGNIIIQAPPRSGSTFLNHKNYLVLFYSPFAILITSSHLLILVKQ